MRRITLGAGVLALALGLGTVGFSDWTAATSLVTVAQASERESSDAPRRCSQATLHGRFGFVAQGTVFPPVLPAVTQVANSGRITFDGRGSLRGVDTVSLGGQIIQRTFEGVYTVRADCVVNATANVLTGTPGMVIAIQATIVDNGEELLFIETDPGNVYTGTAKKM